MIILILIFNFNYIYYYRTLGRFIINMMMGEHDVEQLDVPAGPLALPGPTSTTTAQPLVPPVELETAEPMIAFGVAITKEEKEEGKT